MNRRRRAGHVVAAALAAVTWPVAAAGCGGSGSPGGAAVPVLHVVTGLYPLAQAAVQIGNGKATVVDVVPPGDNPATYRLGATEIATVRAAGLVLTAQSGPQPSFEEALSGAAAPRVTVGAGAAVGDAAGGYFWLDPAGMKAAVPTIEAAMADADPAAAGAFRDGAQAFDAALDSTAIDYQSTLSSCPRRSVFAADSAFAGVAKRFDLTYVRVGTSAAPDPGAVAAAASSIRAAGASVAFSESWVPEGTVVAAAAAAGARVRSLDTLLGPPPGGWPHQAGYINLLESNLGTLSAGLGCVDSNGGP